MYKPNHEGSRARHSDASVSVTGTVHSFVCHIRYRTTTCQAPQAPVRLSSGWQKRAHVIT
eukprot:scaffold121003_cov75-Phaeocystis_antarctica.AAC.1